MAFEQTDQLFLAIDKNQDGLIDLDEVIDHVSMRGFVPKWASEARFEQDLQEFLSKDDE